MRHLKSILFILFVTTLAFSQTSSEKFSLKSKVYFEDSDEKIFAFDLLDEGKKIRFVGERDIQIWDVENNKIHSSLRHKIESLRLDTFGGISPDKSKLLVRGFETAADKKSPKLKTPAKIYDLETAKLLAVLDKTAKPIHSAKWSKNGKTLVTFSHTLLKQDETEICFWDGETLEFRASVVINDITWFFLSEDGESFFTTSVPEKKGLFWIPYNNGKANVINIWNTHTAKNECNLLVGNANFQTNTFKLMPSPDGSYIALVAKSKKPDAEHRVMVWQIGNGELPKYTITANQKIRDSKISYSPDGKYFAFVSGTNIQFYELETGKMIAETAGSDIPDFWLNNNQTVIYHQTTKIKAVQIPGGNLLFEEPVIYRTQERSTGTFMTDSNGNSMETTETEVVDFTTVVPHPNTKIFLTYSGQSVKVYDAGGRYLQTLVTPPPIIKSTIKILGVPIGKVVDYGKNLVKRAEWSDDGKFILILSSDQTAVSIWEMKN